MTLNEVFNELKLFSNIFTAICCHFSFDSVIVRLWFDFGSKTINFVCSKGHKATQPQFFNFKFFLKLTITSDQSIILVYSFQLVHQVAIPFFDFFANGQDKSDHSFEVRKTFGEVLGILVLIFHIGVIIFQQHLGKLGEVTQKGVLRGLFFLWILEHD